MIVYNVQRQWFTMKDAAEMYRKALGLKPDATGKVEINGRDDLALLLNALCEPQKFSAKGFGPIGEAIVDRAYVDPAVDVPLFLRKSRARLFGEPEPVE